MSGFEHPTTTSWSSSAPAPAAGRWPTSSASAASKVVLLEAGPH